MSCSVKHVRGEVSESTTVKYEGKVLEWQGVSFKHEAPVLIFSLIYFHANMF